MGFIIRKDNGRPPQEHGEEDDPIDAHRISTKSTAQDNDVEMASLEESMVWQLVAGATAAVFLLVLMLAVFVYIYKRRHSECKQSIINGSSGHWIPPSESFNRIGILQCVKAHISHRDDRKNSSGGGGGDDDDDDVYPKGSLDSPIGLTSGAVTPSAVQPVNLGVKEKRHSFIRSSKQRQGSRSSSPMDSSSKASDEDEGDDTPNQNGKIWFRVKHNPEEELLSVEIVKAKYLKGRSIFYSPRDPFVRVYLLPDETNYFQTQVKHRTFSPKFKETFTFKMETESASSRSLKFVIYDFDKRCVRHSLGHVTVPLVKLDTTTGDITCSELDDSLQSSVYIGEIQLALFCNPFTDKFKATVIRMRNLPMKGVSKNTDVYVKADLYHGTHQAKSKTSLIHPMEANVEFQETFSFGVSGRLLDSCSLIMTVIRRVRGSHKDDSRIGQVVVGPFMFARGRGLQHWQEMLANTRTSVEKWHNLSEVT